MTRREPSDIEIAAMLAEAAARMLRRIAAGKYPPARLDSASWRLADALEHVRRAAPGSGAEPLPGVDMPTGMGAQLVSRRVGARPNAGVSVMVIDV